MFNVKILEIPKIFKIYEKKKIKGPIQDSQNHQRLHYV